MSASDRMRLAVIAGDLARTADTSDTMPRHAARLERALATRPRPATSLADLDSAPAWLRGSASVRDALALRAAVMLAAPHLARCIDGARLQAVVAIAGAEALDAAIAAGADRDPAGVMDIEPDDLPAIGLGVLVATLAPALAALLPAAPPVDPAAAQAALADALRAP